MQDFIQPKERLKPMRPLCLMGYRDIKNLHRQFELISYNNALMASDEIAKVAFKNRLLLQKKLWRNNHG